jgi:DNA adenine methylase
MRSWLRRASKSLNSSSVHTEHLAQAEAPEGPNVSMFEVHARPHEASRANMPLLRWAGSKKRQYQALKQLFPDRFERYVEPFAGSAAFLFRMGCKEAAINDINPDVCKFYEDVKRYPERFLDFMKLTPREEEIYYECRAIFNERNPEVDQSVLFYYLNRNCFNGIYRVSRSGRFNVPFAGNRVAPYLTPGQFRASIEQLQSVQVSNEDFEVFIRGVIGPGDFVFLDPPYYVSEKRVFGEYNVVPFGSEDLKRLRGTLSEIHKLGAKFLLTYPATTESLSIATAWKSRSAAVLRTIAGDPDCRKTVQELLISNYDS